MQLVGVAVEGQHGGVVIWVVDLQFAAVVAGVGHGWCRCDGLGCGGGLERSQCVAGWLATRSAQVSGERGGNPLLPDRQGDGGRGFAMAVVVDIVGDPAHVAGDGGAGCQRDGSRRCGSVRRVLCSDVQRLLACIRQSHQRSRRNRARLAAGVAQHQHRAGMGHAVETAFTGIEAEGQLRRCARFRLARCCPARPGRSGVCRTCAGPRRRTCREGQQRQADDQRMADDRPPCGGGALASAWSRRWPGHEWCIHAREPSWRMVWTLTRRSRIPRQDG